MQRLRIAAAALALLCCLSAAQARQGAGRDLLQADAPCSFQADKCFPSPAKVLTSTPPGTDADK